MAVLPSVPAVQNDALAALEELLGPGDPLEGVLVRFGIAAELPDELERVYVVDEDEWVLRRGGTEQGRLESYRLRIIVEVFHSGDETDAAKEASDRRWELVAAVDLAMAQSNVANYEHDGELRGESVTVPSANGWIARTVLGMPLEEFG